MGKLLSIAIPTSNRQEYLVCLLDLFRTMDLEDVEVVIQDNSDDESIILDYLKDNPCESFKYYHQNGNLSQMENSEFAVSNCTGRFVCFIGDDDYVSGQLVDFVRCMEKYDIECALFQIGLFLWPDTGSGGINNSDLRIKAFKGVVRLLDVRSQYDRLLKNGALFLNRTPQLYQAVVRKDRLDEIKSIAGFYFPGPSPDMAVAASLCNVIKKMVFCDVPYVSSGQSKRSAAGLAMRHQHKGKLGDIKMLPSNIEDRWLPQIPRIWTGPTIYAQSANEAFASMGDTEGQSEYNWNFFYAYFYISFGEYRNMLKDAMKHCESLNMVFFWTNIPKAFLTKCVLFFKARITSRKDSVILETLKTSRDAGCYTDERIKSIDIEDMFRKMS